MSAGTHPITHSSSPAGNDLLALDSPHVLRNREQIEAWFRAMDQLEAGEVIPGGRNQEALGTHDELSGMFAEGEHSL